jgi:hypothetical protein
MTIGIRRRCTLENRHGTRVATDDRVNLESSQVCRKFRKSIRLVLGKTPLDKDALALDVAKIFKPLPKRLAGRCPGVSSEITDPRHFLRLLRLGSNSKNKH